MDRLCFGYTPRQASIFIGDHGVSKEDEEDVEDFSSVEEKPYKYNPTTYALK